MENSKKADLPTKDSSNSPGPDPRTKSSSPTVDSPNHHSANSPDPSSPSSPQGHMALVAHNNPGSLLTGSGGINKRYRPAPAKTFQCRGYGECRMVFSRSEHLARHIRYVQAFFHYPIFLALTIPIVCRKHTGERPFTCHCGKQFSRLDNLRQHAQTVHADKQDQNEQMMRDLTSLHATMAAASKVGAPRGKRGQAAASSTAASSGSHENGVKQEDMGDSFRGRPGTSTGYEGDHNGIIYQGTTWHVQSSDMDRANSRPTNNHSFRDPSQSFLAPSSSTSSQSQSFLGFPTTFNFVSDFSRDGRPGSSSSRPTTAGVPTHLHEHSHPSLPSSPPLSPLHHPAHSPSHLSPHNTYFPFQGQLTSDDHPQQLAQARRQHQHHISRQNLLSLDWPIEQTYQYQGMDVSANWQQQQHQHHTATMQNQLLHQDHHTNHHFPSTLRRSPTHNHQLAGPSRLHPQSTLGNELSQDQMEMMGRVESPVGTHRNTNMAPSPGLSPDDSPSWNSAMTQMQMPDPEHFYRAQAHARQLHLDSQHQHRPSPSSIVHLSQAHHYTQDLHRQQQEQMRLQREAARRHSEEAEYLQNFVATFHPQQQQQQYFQLSEEPSHRHHYQMHHPAHDQQQLHSPRLIDQGYSQNHHPQMQQEHYLVEEGEESPTMTKYGSPSVLHTPPLLLE